jgi:ribosomal protein L37AE/L43A
MRLNTKKCKVLFIPGKDKESAPTITLNNEQLETVDSYKYLGIELNIHLDPNQQWQRVYSLISSYPHLVKQLKRCGFKEDILITSYKSLVLSHFSYSSTVLDSCTVETKLEMSSFQNRVLRIINITPERAFAEYGILDIDDQIDKSCFQTVNRLLANENHQLTKRLASNKSRTRANDRFHFTIPTARRAKFNKNPVIKTLRKLRDKRPDLYTAENIEPISRKRTTVVTQTPQTTAKAKEACPYCKKDGFVRLKTHLNKCSMYQNTAAAVVTQTPQTTAKTKVACPYCEKDGFVRLKTHLNKCSQYQNRTVTPPTTN